ncbi:MAG: Gfo/Idh/MocA family oxidoreductase, partial [Chloroflexota bacterium]|nr:Gfo/Idh/MocA family oxidoreductase [Chloroflexota bacterium]
VQQVAAWRHAKLRGGYVLEYGVHDADLLLFFMGDVERVYAETHLWERKRYTGDAPLVGHLRQFYGHRVQEAEEKGEAIECTAEDMAVADIRFRSGAAGQLSMSIAMPGEPTHASMLYCSEGSLKLPGSRSGRPVVVTRSGVQGALPEGEALALAPRFQLDEVTARFFGGQRRLSSYEMPFEQVDRKLVAIELQDFASAILDGTELEVPGEAGLKAVALCYAILESGHASQAVSFADVVEDRVNAYQAEINESVGL